MLRTNQYGPKQIEGFCEDLSKVFDLHAELYKECIEVKHQGASYNKADKVPASTILRTISDIKTDKSVKERAAQELVRYVCSLQQRISASYLDDVISLQEQCKEPVLEE